MPGLVGPPRGGDEPLAVLLPPPHLRATSALCPLPAPLFLPQLKMAAEVDFGDRELFEQLDGDEEAPAAAAAAQPLGARLEEDEEQAALRQRLRDCEETVRRLRAENILTGRDGRRGRTPLLPRGGAGGPARLPPRPRAAGRARGCFSEEPLYLNEAGERSWQVPRLLPASFRFGWSCRGDPALLLEEAGGFLQPRFLF